MDPYDVDVEDKVDWSSRTETIFIRIVHDHVKKGDLQTSTFTKKIWNTINDELLEQCHKRFNVGQLKSNQVPLFSDEDRELEKKFLGHGVHVYIEDDDSMEPLSEMRTEKRHCRQVATSTEREQKNEQQQQ
ncbi:hypothetical protein CUMW_220960, partial [Citrus unshiu]